jgi:predicted ester cyclase
VVTNQEVGSMTDSVTTESGAATGAGSELADASRRMIEESFNEGKFDLIDQYVAPEAPNHDPALPASLRGLRGPELVKRLVQSYRGAFPDLRMTVDDAGQAGEKVFVQWHAEGTHRGELEGLAPTGVRVAVTGISIDRWSDGKIVESWTQWGNLGLARQLGAAPPEGSAGEKVGLAIQRLVASRMRKKNQL